jgi:hypothetical protein
MKNTSLKRKTMTKRCKKNGKKIPNSVVKKLDFLDPKTNAKEESSDKEEEDMSEEELEKIFKKSIPQSCKSLKGEILQKNEEILVRKAINFDD